MENVEQNNSQTGSMSTVDSSSGIPGQKIPPNHSNGAMIAISIIVIILLIIGGLFVWGSQFNNTTTEETPTPEVTPSSDTVSQSDDLNSIENEANATVINSSSNLDYSLDTQ